MSSLSSPSLRQTAPWLLLASLGAALLGLAVVVWIASNWAHWGGLERLGLVGAALLGALAVARRWPALTQPVGWFVWLVIGAWLALFGQIYQTGADPWQLFAWWAVLSLPLLPALKSDALGAAWVLVLHLAVQLAAHAHGFKLFLRDEIGAADALVGWGLWLLPVGVALALHWLGWLGQKPCWARRTAYLLALGHGFWAAAAVIFWGGFAGDVLLVVVLAMGLALRHGPGPRWDALTLCCALGGLALLLLIAAGRLLFQMQADLLGALLLMVILGVIVFGGLIRILRTQWHAQAEHLRSAK